MRFLGIDYGQERTGLALSDPGGRLAFPLATLSLAQFGQRRALLLDAVAEVAHERAIDAAVLGLPLLESGGETLTTAQVRNIAPRLQRRLGVPMYFMPELLSTDAARKKLLEIGVRGKKLKAALDQAAACQILLSFLAQAQEDWQPI